MDIIITGNAEELKRGTHWWNNLEMKWKMAFNEAVFGKGPTIEPPKDEELIILLVRADTLRFAGTGAYAPNVTNIPDNLSGVAGLPHLTYLSFTDSKLNSLKEISGLVNLRHLYVYNNELSSLIGVEKMIHLEELVAHNNTITSLQPVRKLTNLKTLYVAYNRLTSLDGITAAHEKNLVNFHVLPNDQLRQREIIRVQNNYGILCKKG